MIEIVVIFMLWVSFVAFLLSLLMCKLRLPHLIVLSLLLLSLNFSSHHVILSLPLVLLFLLLSRHLLLFPSLHPLCNIMLLLLHGSLLAVEVLLLHHSKAFIGIVGALHLV